MSSVLYAVVTAFCRLIIDITHLLDADKSSALARAQQHSIASIVAASMPGEVGLAKVSAHHMVIKISLQSLKSLLSIWFVLNAYAYIKHQWLAGTRALQVSGANLVGGNEPIADIWACMGQASDSGHAPGLSYVCLNVLSAMVATAAVRSPLWNVYIS